MSKFTIHIAFGATVYLEEDDTFSIGHSGIYDTYGIVESGMCRKSSIQFVSSETVFIEAVDTLSVVQADIM